MPTMRMCHELIMCGRGMQVRRAYGELRANTLAFKAFSFQYASQQTSPKLLPASRALCCCEVWHPPQYRQLPCGFLAMASPKPAGKVILSHNHTPSRIIRHLP